MVFVERFLVEFDGVLKEKKGGGVRRGIGMVLGRFWGCFG